MKKLKEFLMNNKYLFIVLPILTYGWSVTLTDYMNGDFPTEGDFAFVLSILIGASCFTGYTIYRGIKAMKNNPF